jgi:hypothetical protein
VPALGVALPIAPAELGHGGHLLLLPGQHQEEHAQGGNGGRPRLLRLHLPSAGDGFFFRVRGEGKELLCCGETLWQCGYMALPRAEPAFILVFRNVFLERFTIFL